MICLTFFFYLSLFISTSIINLNGGLLQFILLSMFNLLPIFVTTFSLNYNSNLYIFCCVIVVINSIKFYIIVLLNLTYEKY
jgi:hypothetical protein